MRKAFLPLLALLCAATLSFSACGESTETTAPTDTPSLTDENIQTQPETAAPETESPDSFKLEWTKKTYTVSDTDGYTYDVTVKFSPWILLSNTDIVNSAWSEIGGDNALPGFDDWSLKHSSYNEYMRFDIPSLGITKKNFSFAMTDMYYCVGTVSIKNTTSGWDITSDHPRTVDAGLTWSPAMGGNHYGACSIGRVYYSNKTSDKADCAYVSASMKKNTWGPVAFVMMAPENFSPKYPDGQYFEAMQNGKMSYVFASASTENEYISVGVVGKDGVYTAPVS